MNLEGSDEQIKHDFHLFVKRLIVPRPLGWLSWLNIWFLISAWVMILRFEGLSLTLALQSLLGILSLLFSLLLPRSHMHAHTLSLSLKINEYTLKKNINSSLGMLGLESRKREVGNFYILRYFFYRSWSFYILFLWS